MAAFFFGIGLLRSYIELEVRLIWDEIRSNPSSHVHCLRRLRKYGIAEQGRCKRVLTSNSCGWLAQFNGRRRSSNLQDTRRLAREYEQNRESLADADWVGRA